MSFLAAATAIGQGLYEQAVQGPDGCPMWQGDDLAGSDVENARIVRTDTGSGLYSGAAGIGWFLAQLGVYVHDTAMCRCGVDALQGAVRQCQASIGASTLSLYGGAAGVALAAWQVGRRLSESNLQAQALRLGVELARHIDAGELPLELDLISGAAGVAVALAAFHREAALPHAASACRRLGEQLLQAATSDGILASWPASDASADALHLCGLAHGASGIAWALFEAARVTGIARFAACAQQALAYERSWFMPSCCNWPDLRGHAASARPLPVMTAWCHGAIGVAALRLHWYGVCPNARLLAEAGAGLHAARDVVATARRSLAAGNPFDATLCHGLGGAAELYTLAHQITGVADHGRAAQRTGRLCLDLLDLTRGRWTCGLRGAKQIPGLMVGEAGIGVMLLRLHDATAIGSPLLAGCDQHVPDMVSNSA